MESLLRRVPEIQFVSDREGRFHLTENAAKDDKELVTVRDEIAKHPLMAGLPWRQWDKSKVCESKIKDFVDLSRSIRARFSEPEPNQHRNAAKENDTEIRTKRLLSHLGFWNSPDGVRMLKQMLEGEDRLYRLSLVDLFAHISAKEAAEGLAKLAIFDVNEEVRGRAVERLRERRMDEWQGALSAGFRYHWEPAAVNAAHALISMKAIDALPALIRLLDQHDPALPFLRPETGNKLQVRELGIKKGTFYIVGRAEK